MAYESIVYESESVSDFNTNIKLKIEEGYVPTTLQVSPYYDSGSLSIKYKYCMNLYRNGVKAYSYDSVLCTNGSASQFNADVENCLDSGYMPGNFVFTGLENENTSTMEYIYSMNFIKRLD